MAFVTSMPRGNDPVAWPRTLRNLSGPSRSPHHPRSSGSWCVTVTGRVETPSGPTAFRSRLAPAGARSGFGLAARGLVHLDVLRKSRLHELLGRAIAQAVAGHRGDEVPPSEREDGRVLGRLHGGLARNIPKQSHLPEEPAGPLCRERSPGSADIEVPPGHDVEPVPPFALRDEHPTRV